MHGVVLLAFSNCVTSPGRVRSDSFPLPSLFLSTTYIVCIKVTIVLGWNSFEVANNDIWLRTHVL